MWVPDIALHAQIYVALQRVSQLVSGAPTPGPALRLDGHRLYAMPFDDAAEQSMTSMPRTREACRLELNPKLTTKRQAGVISSAIVSWRGQMWVPVKDLAKATGAKVNIAFPDACLLEVPSQCSSS